MTSPLPLAGVSAFALDSPILVEEDDLISVFQPIVSLRERSVRAVEALTRVRIDGAWMSPDPLFSRARDQGCQLEVDRFCRRRALTAFAKLRRRHPHLLVSVNIDHSSVTRGRNGFLREQVEAAGLAPRSVMLEVLESELDDIGAHERWVRARRHEGFTIVLDDVGAGHCDLQRVARLEPDVLKIDGDLVRGLSHEYHQRQVFRALSELAWRTGALVIAEGVEDEDDVAVARDLGCDLFQGYYFGRPSAHGSLVEDAIVPLERAGERCRREAVETLARRRRREADGRKLVKRLSSRLAASDATMHTALLTQLLGEHSDLEALYVLDGQGIQTTETIVASGARSSGSLLFRPAVAGTDQSHQPYFFSLEAGPRSFTSEPYISNASGRFCVTLSRAFLTRNGQRHVLCCDLRVES